MTAIVIIEPHPVLRFGLTQLLSEMLPSRAIKAFDYSKLDDPGNSNLQSDFVLLSIASSSQCQSQLDAVQRIYFPQAVMLLAEAADINPALYTGQSVVRGVVKKDATPELLVAAVKLILAGGTCFPVQDSRSGERSLFSLYEPVKWPPENQAQEKSTAKLEEAKLLGLTPRQYEVLVLLARGYPLKTVGKHLNISVATAKAHTETLYQRLDVHNRNAAVYAAVARGATLGWSNITTAQKKLSEGKSIQTPQG